MGMFEYVAVLTWAHPTWVAYMLLNAIFWWT
jgi:hypothetical protein